MSLLIRQATEADLDDVLTLYLQSGLDSLVLESAQARSADLQEHIADFISGFRELKLSRSKAQRAVLKAIDKTEILPRDTDGRVHSPLLLVFKPND